MREKSSEEETDGAVRCVQGRREAVLQGRFRNDIGARLGWWGGVSLGAGNGLWSGVGREKRIPCARRTE